MKISKFYAFVIITLLILEFNFMIFTFLTSFQNNNANPQNITGDLRDNLIITNSPENPLVMYSNYDPNFAPLSIVTLVGQNDPNYDANFAYLASIPIALYKESGVRKVSPLLFDGLNLADQNFLVEWRNYLEQFNSWNGIDNIVYIGNISSATKTQAENILNPEMLLNPSLPLSLRQRIEIGGSNTFDLTANIARYFWYRPDTVIIAPIAENFLAPQSTVTNFSDFLAGIDWINRTGEVNSTNLVDTWTSTDLTINSGGILVQVNNTNDVALELFGNNSNMIPWMYDTNKKTKTNWVFFPNVTVPADISDWGLKVVNQIATPIAYDLAFFNLSYQTYSFEITNSEGQCQISMNWNDSTADLKFWVLDPTGQLVDASSRTIFESGVTNRSSTVLYPELGNWSVLVTRLQGSNPVSYNLSINITESSPYQRKYIESGANGAVIASLLNKPLLYVTNTTIPTETEQAIIKLNASKAILVDPYNLMIENISINLAALNISLADCTNLTSQFLVYDFIYNLSGQSDLILSSINNGYFAPASLIAAFHGAPLISTLNESHNIHAGALRNYALDSWVGFQNPGNSGLLNQSIPQFQDMKGLADDFYSWISTYNLDRSGSETVLVVSPIWELNPFFDRAIYGKSHVGRFSTLSLEDLAVSICRNIFYPALSYTNMSYSYTQRNKLTSVGGNATLTSTQLFATGFLGDFTACQLDDSVYHSYLNSSNGRVVMAYYVNLSDSQILYKNITQIEISINGKIDYSNNSIQAAGWGIWNWTSGTILELDTQFLNSTTDQTDTILIDTENNNSLIQSTNSRIEIFVLVNTTGPSINTSIDFIQFNVTYNHIQNDPSILASSITYWHDFDFQGTPYNYSTLIPLNFTQNGYEVVNSTGYQEVYTQLLDDCKFWYYAGNNTFNLTGGEWDMLFTQNDYWRAYGDFNDSQGSNPANPDADGDHFVTANATIGKWQTRTELLEVLTHLPSTFMLLQEGYGTSTLVPEYLSARGATAIVVDLKQNSLGYSEHFAYVMTNALLEGKSVGEALYNAFNQTSHIYSKGWEGLIIGGEPFSNYTEENQAFILYGDPELNLINSTFNLPQPVSYRPLIHEISPFVFRSKTAEIWVNITDLDSDPRYAVSVDFNIITNNPNFTKQYDANFNTGTLKFQNVNVELLDRNSFPFESLTYKTVIWDINDSTNNFQLTVPILLRSALPEFDSAIIILNDTGSFNPLSHGATPHDTIGRVNESIAINVTIRDEDTFDWGQYDLMLIFKNINVNSTHNLNMTYLREFTEVYSEWGFTYTFDALNATGRYDIYVQIEDESNETITQYLNYFYVINWPSEPNGANFVITNGTGLANSVFRENESIEIFAALKDMDGGTFRTRILPCEGNGTITGTPESVINVTGTPEATQLNDSIYHTYYSNSTGQLLWSYFVNMSDYGINYGNISTIDVAIDGKLGYSNSSINIAGWGLWNWTAGDLEIINSTIFNATTDQFDTIRINGLNLSDFVNPSENNRLELFVLANTSGPAVNISIDFIEFSIVLIHNTPLTQEAILCLYKAPDQWINNTMLDDDLDDNWTLTYTFTRFNESGIWIPFINIIDKDGLSVLLNSTINVTVMNHLPDLPTNVTITDFNLTTISSVFRNNTIRLFGNATDFDVAFRTSNLTVYACLNDSAGVVRYQEVMAYSSNMSLWTYNFTPQNTDPTGNWTYYVSVVDEAGGRTNSSGLILRIFNNIPVIQMIKILPADLELFVGETLSINVTCSDIEQLANITIFIDDGEGNIINQTALLGGQSTWVLLNFMEANYTSLASSGTWNVSIKLYDSDGDFTGEFTLGVGNNSIIIIVHPRQTDDGQPFPYEIIIIIAIVITTVLATYLVYRTRKREAAVVPAARVKQIIKKISKERDVQDEEAKADIQARIKAIDIKQKPKIEILPEERKELSEIQIENLNKEMRKLVKDAQDLLDKNQFEAASIAYHDASKLATQLEKNEIAKVYQTRSEEILAKKSELKKQAKREEKLEKKELKEKRKMKEKLSRADIETIKEEIGDLMRSARKSINEGDNISAAKQYKEVANMYRRIGDEEKARIFEEKADSL